jgi:predicted acylesterase/phospholipase RssA
MWIGPSRTIQRMCPLWIALACAGSINRSFAPLPHGVMVDGGVVDLGEPVPPGLVLSQTLDGVVALRSDKHGGVARAMAQLDSMGRVVSITSDFVHSVSYDSLRVEYARKFGAPRRSTVVRRGEVPADVETWQDERTELQLVHDPNRNAWTIRAVLLDRRAGGRRM